MIRNNNFRRKKGKVKSKKYRIQFLTFDERKLNALTPQLNIKRYNKISKIKKDSLKRLRKYRTILRMKFKWIIAIIVKYKLKHNK